MQETELNLGSVIILEISGQDLEFHLADRFNRAISYDMAMNEYLSEVNHQEVDLKPELTRATNFATILIRRGVYSALVNIADYGTPKLWEQSKNVLEVCRKYQMGEVASIHVSEPGIKMMANIRSFIQDQMGLEYEARYLK